MRILGMMLFFCFLAFSCQSNELDQELDERENEPQTSGSTYLALGDSYTIGQGIAAEGRWPVHLASLLVSLKKINVGDPRIIARTGWTTGDLLAHLKTQNLPNDFGLVSLQIGVNNQYRGYISGTFNLEPFRTEFKTLLATSIQFAQKNPKNVVVLTIPDWGATPYGNGQNRALISEQIKQYNAVILAEATSAGVAVVDVYDLSLKVSQNAALVASDGLHYSSQMHLEWAQRVLPVAATILKP